MILLKVYSEDGVEIYRIEDFPCKIGRALDNHIIINDRSVSGHHAVIDKLEGVYVLQDLESVNGVRYQKKLHKSLNLDKPAKVLLGEVSIDIRSSQEISEDTVNLNVKDIENKWPTEISPTLKALAALLVSSVLYFLFARFLQPDFESSKYVGIEIAILFYYAVLGAGLAIWAKIQTQRYYFMEIIFILVVSTTLLIINKQIAGTITFNINSEWFELIWDLSILSAISFYVLDQVGRILFAATSARKRTLINLAIIGSFLSAGYGVTQMTMDKIQTSYMSLTIGYPLRSFSQESYGLDKIDKELKKISKKNEEQRLELLEKAKD